MSEISSCNCKDSLRVGNFFLQLQGLIACRKFLLAIARTHCASEISSCNCKDSLRVGNFFLLKFGAVARQQFLPAVFVDALVPSAYARAPTERKKHRLATEKKVKRCDFSRGAFIFPFL